MKALTSNGGPAEGNQEATAELDLKTKLSHAVGRHPSPAAAPVDTASAVYVRGLFRLVPRPLGTYLLMAINIVIFLLMLSGGGSLSEPSIPHMLAWGANSGPLTLNGEWWRLGSSTVIHFGIVHVALNMYALYVLGPMVERMLGTIPFVAVYVLAGLVGSLVSVAWNPWTVSAGASGSVSGTFGALIGVLIAPWARPPKPVTESLARNVLLVLGVNGLYGLLAPNIDLACHAGGLVGGAIFGFALARRIELATPQWYPRRTACVVLLALLLLVGGAAMIPRTPVHLDEALQALFTVEEQSAVRARQIGAAFDARRLGKSAFGSRMQSDVLTPWLQVIERLQAQPSGGRIPTRVTERVQVGLRYARQRHEAWAQLVNAIEQDSPELLRRAKESHAAADLMAQKYAGNSADQASSTDP